MMNFFLDKFLEILNKVGSRYFLLAGGAFLLCYFILRNRIAAQKIQVRFPATKDYVREILFSFSSMCIFAGIVTAVVFNPSIRPYTTIYKDIATYGWTHVCPARYLFLLDSSLDAPSCFIQMVSFSAS